MKGVVDYLSDLIRIPSVSSLSNRPLVEYVTAELKCAGWRTQEMVYHDRAGIEKVNLVAAPRGHDDNDPSSELTFVCHTDTVPYAVEWAEALDPFVKDGHVHGCGACDVKGFLACLLTAIRECRPSKLKTDLRVVLTADEEVGCIGASRLIAQGLIKPRRVVVGEPTSLHPARAGKGYCLAEITVVGTEAHSAHPLQGKSAIYAAAQIILELKALAVELAKEANPFFSPGFTTLNVGTIQGGTAKNIVPGVCSLQVEWRPLPGNSAQSVMQAIHRIACDVEASEPGISCVVRVSRNQAGFEFSDSATVIRSIERCTGRSATSIPFGSEASLFAAVAEEVVVFGPGDMRTAHSSRECVPISELEMAVSCVQHLMCV
jgi:acetylornithine deacetylase